MPPSGKRDYAAEYARRQEIARQRGFRSYYERRTRDYPGAPAPADLGRRRGHTGKADFLAYIRPGDLVMLAEYIDTIRTDQAGRFVSFDKRVVPADRREERVFRIRNQTRASLRRLIRDELKRGAVLTIAPSLDQRHLLDSDGVATAPADADIRRGPAPYMPRKDRRR